MRIVVTGATGNVGTSVLEALRDERSIDEIVGIARRQPSMSYPRTRFVSTDIVDGDLVPIFRGADAVVHLRTVSRRSTPSRCSRYTTVDGLPAGLPAHLAAELAELLADAERYAAAAQALNTTRAYASDWNQFQASPPPQNNRRPAPRA